MLPLGKLPNSCPPAHQLPACPLLLAMKGKFQVFFQHRWNHEEIQQSAKNVIWFLISNRLLWTRKNATVTNFKILNQFWNLPQWTSLYIKCSAWEGTAHVALISPNCQQNFPTKKFSPFAQFFSFLHYQIKPSFKLTNGKVINSNAMKNQRNSFAV